MCTFSDLTVIYARFTILSVYWLKMLCCNVLSSLIVQFVLFVKCVSFLVVYFYLNVNIMRKQQTLVYCFQQHGLDLVVCGY